MTRNLIWGILVFIRLMVRFMRLGKRYKYWCFIFVIPVCISCNYRIYKEKNLKPKVKYNSENFDNEFYYAFTSATKNAIFRNYKEAIRDFNECLKYKRNSAAIHYQLSNIYLGLGNINLARNYADSAVIYDRDENKWYLIHLANIYNIRKETDSTIYYYEKALKYDPNNIDLKYKLALLYEDNENYNKAITLIKECENIIGVSDRIYVSKHQIYSKLGMEEEAINELQLAIKYYPENYNLIGLLAEYYADINNYNLADKYYNILLNIDSGNIKAQISYAEFLRETNQDEKAFDYYKIIIENEEINVDFKIGLIIEFIKDDSLYENYNKHVERLIKELKSRYIDNIKVRTLCADFFIRSNELELAKEEMNFVLKTERENYLIWEQLLYIENSLGNYDTVISISNRAIAIFEDRAIFYLFNGIAMIQKGDNKAAVEILERGVKYGENNEQKIQFYNFLAEAYRNLKDFKKSDNSFERVLEIDPNNLLVRNNYSYYLAIREENLGKAEELSKLTVEMEPKNSTYLDTYGWILFKMGENIKAKKYIERAIKNGGHRNSEILEHYGDILYDLSDMESAIYYWSEAEKYTDDKSEIVEKIKRAEKRKSNSY